MHKLTERSAMMFGSQHELLERLARGQPPETPFLTCPDSRIDPSLLTQTEPGEFILRNAGSIVPPHGAVRGGEAAAIELAVAGLGVKDTTLCCGPFHCGTIRENVPARIENPGTHPVMASGLARGKPRLHARPAGPGLGGVRLRPGKGPVPSVGADNARRCGNASGPLRKFKGV